LRHRGGETEQEEEDGAEVIHGTRHKLYHEGGRLSRALVTGHWIDLIFEWTILLR
jgi:hypothetical protein